MLILVSKYLELKLTNALKPTPNNKAPSCKFGFSGIRIYSDFTALFHCAVPSNRQ